MSFIQTLFSTKPQTAKTRNLLLDYIRGTLILLVLYHHATGPFGGYVLQFHMPALFLLSGYTDFLLGKKSKTGDYIKSRFQRLIVPYLFFEAASFLLFCLRCLLCGDPCFPIKEALISIFSCVNNSYVGLFGRLWFLPAMFVSSVLAHLILHRLSKHKRINGIVALPVLLFLSYATANWIPFRLPFTLDIALLATAFLLLGHLLGEVISAVLNKKSLLLDLSLLCGFLLLFLACNFVGTPYCGMYVNKYNHFPLMLLAALSGTMAVFLFIKLLAPLFGKVCFLKNILVWYSVNSLATFPVHLTIKVLALPVLTSLGLNHWAVLLVLMFFLNIPIVNLITHYCPVMLGHLRPRERARSAREG